MYLPCDRQRWRRTPMPPRARNAHFSTIPGETGRGRATGSVECPPPTPAPNCRRCRRSGRAAVCSSCFAATTRAPLLPALTWHGASTSRCLRYCPPPPPTSPRSAPRPPRSPTRTATPHHQRNSGRTGPGISQLKIGGIGKATKVCEIRKQGTNTHTHTKV